MMSRSRKLLGLIPFIAAFFFSDKTLASYGVMVVGGMFLWIPYWLAWWLSDGFDVFAQSIDIDYDDNFASRPNFFGTNQANYLDAARAHEYSLNDTNRDGYMCGSQGFGFYSGSTRIHN